MSNTGLLADLLVALLGTFLRELEKDVSIQKLVHECFSTIILFIMAKEWKQPECPRVDEWITKCVTSM